ncbi:MAG: hypothetical protein ACLGIY_25400 [Betaproteobacteria bacterium]|uniref:hypothetical protein n=1 Tax=Acidovorax sp. 94 TaxID=2135633 RepID=UPI000967BB43|nr:hypothetical protein [Acidovorax sp. 94]OJV67256.1 MAG: hypothetical protein BGO35_01980 [Burkholderiales bacterium 64-34]
MTYTSYFQWEERIIEIIEHTAELCRSDAQAVVEGQPVVLKQLWDRRDSPDVASDAVLKAAWRQG